MKRSLSSLHLVTLGVGSTVGAGIYVMTGTAAAEYAGPSIIISFIIAAFACIFTALSYGELAASLPVSGSAYSYAYVSLGEGAAWAVGWLLLLEYGISVAAVAAGFSAYLTSLLAAIGIDIPKVLTTATCQTVPGSAGLAVSFGWNLDLVGALGVVGISGLLLFGVHESARVNTIIVLLKAGVLLVFIACGLFSLHSAYWHPFIPHYEGGFRFGVPGIFRAASIIFFAYVGFEAVSTASAEARNPQRDVPIGIIGSLVICTLIYIGIAFTLIGSVPYQMLNVADPLSVAVRAMGKPWLVYVLGIGASVGLCSVLLGLLYGQTRIFYAMSRDGLIPPIFSRLHPRFQTPWSGTIVLGIVVAIATATLPIDIISDLVSIGTACAFAIVCFTVIWQRNKFPDAPRPFRVPFGSLTIGGCWIGITPALGMFFGIVMMVPLFVDLIRALLHGNALPLVLLIVYSAIGIVTYFTYSRHHSRLA